MAASSSWSGKRGKTDDAVVVMVHSGSDGSLCHTLRLKPHDPDGRDARSEGSCGRCIFGLPGSTLSAAIAWAT